MTRTVAKNTIHQRLLATDSREIPLTLWVFGEAVGDNETREAATGNDIVIGALDGTGIA